MKYYDHPAYNGYAHELPEDDSRHEQFEKEFNEKGFDETATWSLDYTLASWIVPRLEMLIETQKKIFDSPEFIKECEEMLEGFKFYKSKYFNLDDDEHEKITKRAFELLAKNHRGLWW